MEEINDAMIQHARDIANEIGATAVLVYADAVKSKQDLQALINESRCIVAARNPETVEELVRMGGVDDRIIRVPYLHLTRLSQVKVAALLALSKGMIQREDRIVCLSGSPEYGVLDNLTVLDVHREFEIFSTKALDIASRVGTPQVFDRLLTLVLELANEGKEGKPLGTIFVLGDHDRVMELSSQMVLNPFLGVTENERNIMDPDLKETLREFSTIDGAFVIRDDGVVLAAGRHLSVTAAETDLPRGLGARHRAAAGITSLTNAIAFVISESTGDVRIFTEGKVFIEIEKANRED